MTMLAKATPAKVSIGQYEHCAQLGSTTLSLRCALFMIFSLILSIALFLLTAKDRLRDSSDRS